MHYPDQTLYTSSRALKKPIGIIKRWIIKHRNRKVGKNRKTFRNEIYSDYKANRSEAPDDLAPQFEYIRKSVLAFNLP